MINPRCIPVTFRDAGTMLAFEVLCTLFISSTRRGGACNTNGFAPQHAPMTVKINHIVCRVILPQNVQIMLLHRRLVMVVQAFRGSSIDHLFALYGAAKRSQTQCTMLLTASYVLGVTCCCTTQRLFTLFIVKHEMTHTTTRLCVHGYT